MNKIDYTIRITGEVANDFQEQSLRNLIGIFTDALERDFMGDEEKMRKFSHKDNKISYIITDMYAE